MTGTIIDSSSPSEIIKEVVEERLDDKGNRVKVGDAFVMTRLWLDYQKD